ncbi:MAG: 30S ribosomal protein S5 [Phycisphaerales bacterium]|nr:30S ribosomal protein S5 [Phycisphaerales bacterium]
MNDNFDDSGVDATTVKVFRTSSTVAGGRRFSFGALVVVGDRHGKVAVGYAKSNQVPTSVEKATREGKRKLRAYPLQGRTLPHSVEGRFGASSVRLVPASPGTGVIAGASVRAVLDMLGVQDCLTKAYGSTNAKNLVKATFAALDLLKTRERVEQLRGVSLGTTSVEDAIARGMAAMPAQRSGERAAAPVNTVGDERRRGGGGGRSGGGGRGFGGGGGGGRPRSDDGGRSNAPAAPSHTPAPAPTPAPTTDAPATPPEGSSPPAQS